MLQEIIIGCLIGAAVGALIGIAASTGSRR